MKKTNFASLLAVAGGLAVAACSQPAETAATEADAMSVEDTAEAGAEAVAEAACEAADDVACAAESCGAAPCCAAACCAAEGEDPPAE